MQRHKYTGRQAGNAGIEWKTIWPKKCHERALQAALPGRRRRTITFPPIALFSHCGKFLESADLCLLAIQLLKKEEDTDVEMFSSMRAGTSLA